MFRATLKGLLARKLRLVLSGFAIVLGVMFVAGTLVLSDTLNRSLDSLISGVYADTEVLVTPVTDEDDPAASVAAVPAAALDRIRATPGVREVVGGIGGTARVIGADGKVVGAQKAATNWNGIAGIAELREGREPRADTEIAVDAKLAADGKLTVGDRVDVLTRDPRKTFTLVGIFGYDGGRDTVAGEVRVAFTDAAAQRLVLGEPDAFSSVEVKAADGTSRTDVRAAVAAALGAGFEVRTGEQLIDEASRDAQESNRPITYILLGFAAVSLFVGIFLILNTFSIIVAQRLKELALMRAIGASRGQTLRAVMLEATVTGLLATTVGLGLGILLGTGGFALLTSSLGADLPSVGVSVPVSAVVTSYVVGMVVTWLAAVVPALRASRIAPIAALSEVNTPDRPLTRITVLGGIVAAAGAALLAFGLSGAGSGTTTLWLVLGGVLVSFIGVALLTPVLARPIVSVVGRLFSWSLPGKLGRLNSGRNPRRTAITAAALMVGLALVVGITVVSSSLKSSLVKVGEDQVRADLIVAGDLTSGSTFAPAVGERLGTVQGVTEVAGEYYSGALVNGQDQFVTAVTSLPAYAGMYSMTATQGAIGQLTAGQAALDDEIAEDLGVAAGGTVRVQLPRGEHTLTVSAVFDQTDIARGIYVSDALAEDFADPQLSIASLRLAPGTDVAGVRQQVESLTAEDPEVTVKDKDEFIEQFTGQVDTLLTIVQGLLALAIIIAILGVINTMALSIMERTREFGMLRGIGMRRGQVVRMVTVESVVIALFGALLGVAVGVGLGAASSRALKEPLGVNVITLPWGSIAFYLFLAAVIGVVAAILPAIRAARVDVLKAISYQ